MELARLDEMMAAHYGNAVWGDKRALDSVLRIMDRRHRLHGLDKSINLLTAESVKLRNNSSSKALPSRHTKTFPPSLLNSSSTQSVGFLSSSRRTRRTIA